MTGEQKPGGLEVVAWLYNTVSGEGKALVKPLQYLDGEQVLGVALTPAEPAEERIRSLEAALAAAQNADAEATAYLRDRATTAEAKLARAVEGLEAIRDLGSDGEHSGDRHARCRDFARQTLAALQQEGE